MKKLKSLAKGKGKYVLIVGGAVAAYLAYKYFLSGSSSSTTGSTTPISGTTPPNNVVTRIIKKTQTVTKTIKPADIGSGWAHYNILVGERTQLKNSMGSERTWLDQLKAIPTKLRTPIQRARIQGLTHRLGSQGTQVSHLNSQIHTAWLTAKR